MWWRVRIFALGKSAIPIITERNDYLEKHVSTKWVLEAAAKEIGLPELNGFDFFDLVRRGNPVCEGILNVWMDDISRVIANIIILLDIELVVIGGGISAERELILPRILSYVDRRLPPEMRGQTRIETAMCANRAGVLGAVMPLIFPQGYKDCNVRIC